MPPIHITAIVVTAFILAAHCFADAAGITLGRQVRYVVAPFVWLIYGLTFGRIDLRKCKSCKEREEFLDNLFGPKEGK